MLDGAPAAPVVAMRAINKAFGPVQVLFDVDLEFEAGEVHALVGENGAGKSTLMKILSGYVEPTSGEIRVDNKATAVPDSAVGEALGIVLIHQEFNLAEQLTVEENIFLGRELFKGWFLDKKAMRARSAQVLAHLKADIDPRTRIRDLPVSDKQLVEIAKAVSRDARVLIMDEPTAALTSSETEVLFELIEELKGRGVTIVYISHKLEEVERVADRVTVLRDGRRITTRPMAEVSQDDMARLMVGREITDMYPPKQPPVPDAEIVLEAGNIHVPGLVEGASFRLRRGEILGFAGLVGSGRTGLMEAVVGLSHRSAGEIRVRGEARDIRNLSDATAAGIAYLTKDRKDKGLLLNMTLRPNLTLLALDRFTSLLIDEAREEEALKRAVREFDIRAGRLNATAGTLSGGNQQKLLLAKVMQVEPDIVIVDEPTRGIDVGTKHQIYVFISELARQGKSCVLVSSDMPEIIGLSHRVIVMRSGRVMGELSGEAIEEHEIVRYATGLKGDDAK